MIAERCRKTGKVCLPDKASATKTIAWLVRRSGPSFHRLQAYQCKTCGLWHVGVPHRRAS